MPQADSTSTCAVKRPANYSHCPLKKRPIKYDLVDYSSDSSEQSQNANERTSVQHPMDLDCAEPENLSTKPEDLRLVNSEAIINSISTTRKISVQNVANHTVKLTQPLNITSNSGKHLEQGNNSGLSQPPPPFKICVPQSLQQQQHIPTTTATYYQTPSPTAAYQLPIPPPPPLKVFANNAAVGNGRPLEPISFNPQVTWPNHVSSPPYMPFNFTPPTSTVSGHLQALQYQHRHNNNNSLSNSMYSKPSSSSSSAYTAHYNSHHHHHHNFQNQPQSHLTPSSRHKHEMRSPPHISPPLTNESSYPPMKMPVLHHHRNYLSSESMHHSNLQYSQEFLKFSPKEKDTSKKESHHQYSMKRDLVPIKEHHHSSLTSNNRSRSLSSGSSSDRSSPIPSDSLSPCSTGSSSAITPTNVNGNIRYQCPDCSKSYSTFSGLSKHLQFHCSSQNKKSFVCKFCEKNYTSLGALKMHIRTHTLPCKCTICGKAFSRPWLLQGHIRTHTGEKPFSCEYCHRAFADRSNLRAHLQTHSEVKKYSCQSCSKTFSRTSLLAKHKESGCGNSEAVSVFRISP